MDRPGPPGQAAPVTAPTTGNGGAAQEDPDGSATLAVPFPELDVLLRPYLPALDPAAGIGIPAHVTIIHPFARPEALTDGDLAWLRDLVAATPAFDCRFTRTRWFAQDVLWLEPEPGDVFRGLTEAVAARFPEHPPYGGAYPTITPHLTLARRQPDDDPAESLDRLRAAERELADLLPLVLPADRVSLMFGGEDPRGWHSVIDLPFGRPGAGRAGG